MVGGFVGRALGLGSQHPVIRGIVAFGMIVALGLFIVREYYGIQTDQANAAIAKAQARAATTRPLDYLDIPDGCRLQDSKAAGGTGYPEGKIPANAPAILPCP
jgi:hypothetical protein